MSRPDEQLSTRDFASSSAESRDQPSAADDREDRETSTRYDGTTSAAEPTADVAEPTAEPARDHDDAPLLREDEGAELSSRWESIQVTFVDDPRRAVEEADGLVAQVMQQLADGFARERENLEGQWTRGEDVSTEDLRVALQRYRSFFQRLLSA
jgi:hypothetical protein